MCVCVCIYVNIEFFKIYLDNFFIYILNHVLLLLDSKTKERKNFKNHRKTNKEILLKSVQHFATS